MKYISGQWQTFSLTQDQSLNPVSFLVFQVTAKFAIMFITVQYNVTQVLGELMFISPVITSVFEKYLKLHLLLSLRFSFFWQMRRASLWTFTSMALKMWPRCFSTCLSRSSFMPWYKNIFSTWVHRPNAAAATLFVVWNRVAYYFWSFFLRETGPFVLTTIACLDFNFKSIK